MNISINKFSMIIFSMELSAKKTLQKQTATSHKLHSNNFRRFSSVLADILIPTTA